MQKDSGVHMAKQFECRNIGMDCGFKAKAKDEKSLMKKIAEHAKTAHKIRRIDDELMEKVRSAITEA